MITVTFHCGGCNKKAEGVGFLYRQFKSVNGKGYGFGSYIWDTPDKVTPEGWTASDLIGATYCPTCTKELEHAALTQQPATGETKEK